MKPNPHDLLIFQEVIQARSFTGASRNLGMTKSAVSQAVSRLEHDLGHRLLFRSTRSLSLTEPGGKLLAHCQSLRQLYADICSDFEDEEIGRTGTLTVTAPHALCRSIIVPALSDYLKAQPKASVRLIAEDAPVNLIEQSIDVAIRVGDVGPLTAYVSRLGDLHESLFASRTYVKTKGGMPKEIGELATWDHITNDWQGNPVTYKLAEKEQIRVVPRIRCNTQREVQDFVQNGFGVARLPDLIVKSSGESKHLIRLFPVSKSPVVSLHQFGDQAPPKVRKFVRYMRRALKASHQKP